MNIAFLGNQITYGGGATSLYLTVKSLENFPCKKYVFASQCKSPEMIKYFEKYTEHLEIIRLPEIKSSQTSGTSYFDYLFKRLFTKKYVNEIIERIESYKIDILHINNSVFSHLYKEIKKRSNVKIITHVREMIRSKNNAFVENYIIEQIQKYSDAIITISDNESLPFLGFQRLYILPNAFNFKLTSKDYPNIRESLHVSEDTILIGMIGRFTKSKGQHIFLEVLKGIQENESIKLPYKFLIVGFKGKRINWKSLVKKIMFIPDYGDSILKFIKTNHLESNIIILPYTKNIFEVIKALDIVVRPSMYNDPWGRDIIESMAFRKPIVATGSSEFYVKNGKTGYLTNGTIECMIEAINALANSPESRKAFGELGYNLIFQMCNIDYYGEKLFSIYNSFRQERE